MFMEEKPANAKACIFRCSRPQQAKEQGFKMQEIQNHRPHKNNIERNGKKGVAEMKQGEKPDSKRAMYE